MDRKECVWKLAEDDCDYWETSCKEYFTLIEGTPRENRMNYCPFCGGKIKELD